MDHYDDLHIPEHRPLAYRIGVGVVILAVLALALLAIDRGFDKDPSIDRPGAPSGYHLPTSTTAAPTTTTTSTSVQAQAAVQSAAYTDNTADHASPSDDPGLIVVQGEVYDVNAPHRPACWMEPSDTPEGYEVILYPDTSMHHDADLGFEVSCPEPGEIPWSTPCQEDEVAAPAIDPDPSHGLTWRCVNAEQYENGERPSV